ncbi:MAG TPA: serine hydrolase [Patescibacteria group bacterium]|nr:serine hydrolase [Patescibacteria group bacterium]
MRHFLITFCILLLTGLLTLAGWYFFPLNKFSYLSSYVSPLPNFLTLAQNPQVRMLDLWLPFLSQTSASAAEDNTFTSHSILMYDITTGKTLLSKNPKERMPMASLTKLMTVIIALENKKSDDKYVVDSSDIVGEDSMGLSSGEILSLNELLYGVFLNSGNDAAETLAGNYQGGRSAFIKAMNEKAQALGLTDTHFTNPTGLEGDGDQYTTAYDLLVITTYMLQNFPQVVDISENYTYDIPQTATHKEYDMTNETNLISTYPGVKGLKTGYTPEAGLCLVTYLDYDGHKILGILLDSEDRRNEMIKLLDYSLQSEGITPPHHG